MMMDIMFVPLARPTARRASGMPRRSAIQEYERVSATGIERSSSQVRSWKSDPMGASGMSNSRFSPEK
jgi:hypothetical protein